MSDRTDHIGSSEEERVALDEFRYGMVKAEDALRRSARRLTRSHIDADDLVQDTLLRAWAARRTFERGTNLQAWLLRIQRNLFLSQRRRAWRQVLWDSEAIERILVSSPPQEAAVSLEEVRGHMNRLPEVNRRAVQMIGMEGRSYREAAAELDMCPNSLRSLVSRTRSRLAREPHKVPPKKTPNRRNANRLLQRATGHGTMRGRLPGSE